MSRQKKTKGKGSLEASDSSSDEEEEKETKDSSGDQEMTGPNYDTAESFKSPKNVGRLYDAINERVFNSKLPFCAPWDGEPSVEWQKLDREIRKGNSLMPIIWTNRLKRSGGYCRMGHNNGERVVWHIKLDNRNITTKHELVSLLAHEMCHAAVWLIDGDENDSHGPTWQKYVERCRQEGIVVEQTCHITPPREYKYRCSGCGKEHESHRSVPPRPHHCAPGATWKLAMKQYKGFAFGPAE